MDGTDEMSEGGRREVGKTYSNLVRPGTLVLVRPNTRSILYKGCWKKLAS